MRQLYSKFLLVCFFWLISNLHVAGTTSSFAYSDNNIKDKASEKSTPVKASATTGSGRNDRFKKEESLPTNPKVKRKVVSALPLVPAVSPAKNEDAKLLTEPITALKSKVAGLLNTSFDEKVGPDPFIFTITSTEDSVAIGEEFELTVRVSYVEFGQTQFFLPEWYRYTLKVAMPKGFTQTGGDYKDFCTRALPLNNQSPQTTFTIKGKFEYTPEDPTFKVLRGFEGANEQSEFIFKGEKKIFINYFLDKNGRKIFYHNKKSKAIRLSNSSTISGILPFCTSTGTGIVSSYDINTRQAQSGPAYGCLAEQPSPSWYYLKIKKGGKLKINIKGKYQEDDIDFICWGPFDQESLDNLKLHPELLIAEKVQDCSFNPSDVEDCNFGYLQTRQGNLLKNEAVKDKIYILLVTNYTSNPPSTRTETEISLNKTSGDAETDCGICNVAKPITSGGKLITSGESVKITASGCTNGIITWDNDLGDGEEKTVSPTITTTYRAKCKINGCESELSDGETVSVGSTCTITKPTISGDDSGCGGVTLSYTQTADHTYDWEYSPSGAVSTFTSQGSSAISYPVSASGYYRIKVSKLGGCTDDYSTNTKNPSITPTPATPVVAAPSTTNLYGISSITLSLSTSCRTGENLKWYKDGVETDNFVDASDVPLNTSKAYTAKCEKNGCFGTVSNQIFINNSSDCPSGSITFGYNPSNRSINRNGTITISASNCPSGTSFKWADGNTSSVRDFNYTSNGSFTESGKCTKNVNGNEIACVSGTTESISVACDNLSLPTYSCNKAGCSITEGESIVITGNCASGNFSWLDGPANPRTNSPSSNITYFGKCTSTATGCSTGDYDAPRAVYVNNRPQLSVSITGFDSPCGNNNGGKVSVQTAGRSGNRFGYYLDKKINGAWVQENQYALTWTTHQFLGLSEGQYRVRAVDYPAPDGTPTKAEDNAVSNEVTIAKVPTPTKPIVTAGQTVLCNSTETTTLTASNCNAGLFWYKHIDAGRWDYMGISGITQITVGPGVYQVECSSAGCNAGNGNNIDIWSDNMVISDASKDVCIVWGINNNSQEAKPSNTFTFVQSQGPPITYQTLIIPWSSIVYDNRLAAMTQKAPAFVIPTSSKIDFKVGESVTLNAGGCSGIITWKGGGSATTLTGKTITVYPTAQSTTYKATCSNSTGTCQGPISNEIVLNRTSDAFSISSSATAFCAAEGPIVLRATGCSAPASVVWSTGAVGQTLTITSLTSTLSVSAACYSSPTIKDASTLIVAKSNTIKLFVPSVALDAGLTPVISACEGTTVSIATVGCPAENLYWFTYVGQYINDNYYEIPTPIPNYSNKQTVLNRTVSNTQLSEIVYYQCAGTKGTGAELSCPTPVQQVEIKSKKKSGAKPDPAAIEVCEGQPFNLKVIDREPRDLTYEWLAPGLKSVAVLDASPTKTNVTTTLNALDTYGTGPNSKWRFNVSNECGVVEKTFDMKVTSSPVSVTFSAEDTRLKTVKFLNSSRPANAYIMQEINNSSGRPTGDIIKTLEATPKNGKWNFGDGTPDVVIANANWNEITHTFPAIGEYTVTLTVIDPKNACPKSLSTKFYIGCEKPLPPTKIEQSANTLCLGQSITLKALGCEKAIPTQTKWFQITTTAGGTQVETPISNLGESIILSPSSEGSYNYKAKCVLDECLSDISSAVTFNVQNLLAPKAFVSDPVTLGFVQTPVSSVVGNPVSLSVSGCDGEVVWTTWANTSPSTPLKGAILLFPKPNGTSTWTGITPGTAYTFTSKCVKAANGTTCESPLSNTLSVTFTACPNVVITPTAAQIVCDGTPTVMTASQGNGVFTWFKEVGGIETQVGSGATYKPLENGKFFAKSCNGASVSTKTDVSIVTLKPQITLQPNTNPALAGTAMAFQAADANANTPTYNWTGPNGFNSALQNASIASLSNLNTGIYTVKLTKGTCTAKADVDFYVSAANCPTVFNQNPTVAVNCVNGVATLTVNGISDFATNFAKYAFRIDRGDWVSGATANVFTGVPDGKHTIVIRLRAGAPDDNTSDCYIIKELGETLVACNTNQCEYYVKSVDDANVETTLIPRIGKAYKNLTLSVEDINTNAPLTGTVTYAWTGPNAFVANTAVIQTSKPGKYKVVTTRYGVSCTTETTLSSKPCRELGTAKNACSTKDLTGVADDPNNRLTALNVGDKVQAGDFELTITEITSGDASGWNGKGYIPTILPIVQPSGNIQVKEVNLLIELKNAVFNDCNQLTNTNATATQPTVFTVYDPKNWSTDIGSIDYAFKGLDGIKQDLLDLFNNFQNTTEYKAKIRAKIQELEDLINAASAKQLDPDVKAELQAAIDAIKNPCLPCLEDNAVIEGLNNGVNDNGYITEGVNSNARVATNCSLSSIKNILSIPTPQQLLIKCFGGAAIEILFAYVGKWVEIALDEKKPATNIANYNNIINDFKPSEWTQLLKDAGKGCIENMVPWGNGSSKLLKASAIILDATDSFADEIITQYNTYKTNTPDNQESVRNFIEVADWGKASKAAALSALASVVITSLGNGKATKLLDKFKGYVSTSKGYLFLQKKMGQMGCDAGVFQEICKRLKIKTFCFPAGTLITVPNGYKPIELITPKDSVIAYDEIEQKFTTKKVNQTFKKVSTQLVMLHALGGKLIASPTPEHPFFVKNTYKPAKELVKGDTLLSKTNNFIVIDKVVAVDSVLDVYNFEVEDSHNYLVGEDGVLVHNECFKKVTLPNGLKGAKQINEQIEEILLGRGTPRLEADGVTQKIFQNRSNTAVERKWAGGLEYQVDVPGMSNTYRILKLPNGVDADGNPIFKYGYSTNHFQTVYDFLPVE